MTNRYRLIQFGTRKKKPPLALTLTLWIIAGALLGGFIYLIFTYFIETVFVVAGVCTVAFCVWLAKYLLG
ncbi:MAG: hypothetical protein FWF65_06290 [Bacteroidetes bacterium]|nr:hypothetical protein [Bacteroidota bacterium]